MKFIAAVLLAAVSCLILYEAAESASGGVRALWKRFLLWLDEKEVTD